MVAGEIKVVVSASRPILYVCDGTKTAAHWFLTDTTPEWTVTPPTITNNGQIACVNKSTGGVFQYTTIIISLNGKWWRTNEDWHKDADATDNPAIPPSNGQIGVLAWNHGDIQGNPPDLPSFTVRRGVDSWWWCADGWILQ